MNTSNDVSMHIQSMMKWHFSPSTGSKFWLERKDRLSFDPIKDIRSIDDVMML